MSAGPRYAVGDTVWFVTTTTTAGRHPCPDCLGAKKWSCKSPAGVEMEMDCPRCTRSHGWKEDLDLAYSKHIPRVTKLTIGSVRMDTANTSSVFSYMCVETGVGSGSVYDEGKLYDNEEDANREAAAKCAVLQAENNKQPEAMKAQAHPKMGYFESLKLTAKEQAVQTVRDSYADYMDDSEDLGHTPGIWHVREGSVDDWGVYSFTISATHPAKGGPQAQICSGYGGLSDGFAKKEHGPGNALRIAAAPAMFIAIEQFEAWWQEVGQVSFNGAPACVFALLEAAAKARGEL